VARVPSISGAEGRPWSRGRTDVRGRGADTEEAMESTAHLLRTAVEAEILARTKGCSPSFFERLVVELLVAMGYGGSRTDAGQAIGQAGDGGVDGIIKEDKLGLDVVYVQAKRWDSSVGRPVVQAFAGSSPRPRSPPTLATT